MRGPLAWILAIVAGVVVVLIVTASTALPTGLIKSIPVQAHAVIDFLLAAVLIAAPFLFGFSDVGSATAFFIVMGLVAILSFLGTEWDPAQAGAGKRGPRKRAAAKA